MKYHDDKAIYIHCDGSMVYDNENSGGVGFIIKFPNDIAEDDISDSIGIYTHSNIERLELEGIIQGIEALINYVKKNGSIAITQVSKIVIITDRFAFQDTERTIAYKIKEYRSRGGKNHEGKEIKNWDLLNKLDKTRMKLSRITQKTVRIEYRKRKENKEADKLSKQARNTGVKTRKIAIEGHKIGKRKFEGKDVNYKNLTNKETLIVNIFRKQFLREQCEVNVEIVNGPLIGQKLKIYTDYELQEKLKRGNEYRIKIKKIYNYHIEIYRTIAKRKKL